MVLAGSGAIEQADDVHERGLAGAGLAHDGHKLALVHSKVQAGDDGQLAIEALVEAFDNAPHLNEAAHAFSSAPETEAA